MICRLALLLFVSLSVTTINAQETKKVKQKLPDGSREEFYVLKNSDTIKQGNYVHKDHSGKLLEQGNYSNGKRNGYWENFEWGIVKERGFYKNGMKDSLWETFYNGKPQTKGYYKNDQKDGYWDEKSGSGNYTNGIKSGEWTYFSREGKKDQVYDYSTRKIIWYDSSSYLPYQKTFKILLGSDSQKVVVDFPPLYIGGSAAFMSVLVNNIHYPFAEREKGTQGTVYIAYDINTDGHAENFRVHKSVSPGLDKEAMRVLMLMKDNWSPAIYQGKPITVTMIQPVKFVLH